ncbi:hypothetical protein QE152_g31371 [Popillia japonica]|uniref:Uncharacterized protein n=1 Tax=Popillia japonica TaxID=7064 RepID=A0AAW1J1Q3_POPJA
MVEYSDPPNNYVPDENFTSNFSMATIQVRIKITKTNIANNFGGLEDDDGVDIFSSDDSSTDKDYEDEYKNESSDSGGSDSSKEGKGTLAIETSSHSVSVVNEWLDGYLDNGHILYLDNL